MNAKKILVTGLSGLVGSVLREAAGSEVRFINLDITEGVDITDAGQIRDMIAEHQDAEALIHLAAFTDVSGAHLQQGDESGLCYRLNVTGTRNVVDACAAAGLHVVHVSTDFVFDGEKEGAYTEDDAPRPIEWYGRTKAMAEEAVRDSNGWTILRTAFPYAPGETARPDLVRKLALRLREGEELTLFTDQVITPTFVPDLAAGLLLAAERRPAGEIFHLVGSTPTTPHGLGHKIAEVFGFDASLVRPSSLEEYMKQDPRPRQRRLHLSNAKWAGWAEQNGGAAPLTLGEGLRRVRDSLSDL